MPIACKFRSLVADFIFTRRSFPSLQLKEADPFEAGRINVRLHHEMPSSWYPWRTFPIGHRTLSCRAPCSLRILLTVEGAASPSDWRARQSPGLMILDTSTRFVALLWPPVAMISVHVFSVHFSYMPLRYRTCHCCYFWPSLCCNWSSSRLGPGSHTYPESSALCRAGDQQQFDHC